MMRRRSFPPELLASLRALTVTEALDRLGLHWKRDPNFVPVKAPDTVRLHVSVGGGVVELVATGPKWYDTRQRRGGGGGVDLAMHLLGLSFVDAVKALTAPPPQPQNATALESAILALEGAKRIGP